MKLLTVRETAERLAISPSLVYRLVSEGGLRCYRIGRAAIRFSEQQVQEYLDSVLVDVPREERMPPHPSLKHIRI